IPRRHSPINTRRSSLPSCLPSLAPYTPCATLAPLSTSGEFAQKPRPRAQSCATRRTAHACTLAQHWPPCATLENSLKNRVPAPNVAQPPPRFALSSGNCQLTTDTHPVNYPQCPPPKLRSASRPSARTSTTTT